MIIPPHMIEEQADWIDSWEKGIKVFLPPILLFLGLFGGIISLPESITSRLIDIGLFGSGLSGGSHLVKEFKEKKKGKALHYYPSSRKHDRSVNRDDPWEDDKIDEVITGGFEDDKETP